MKRELRHTIWMEFWNTYVNGHSRLEAYQRMSIFDEAIANGESPENAYMIATDTDAVLPDIVFEVSGGI